MRLASTRLFLVLAMLTLGASCKRRPAPVTSPVSAAYTDGFEVVVFELRDGAPANVRSVPLKEAEAAIASGSQLLIPDAAAFGPKLSAGKSGDSKTFVSVQPLGEGKQRIRVSFHESSRTFVYEYEVDGARVRPVSSEYRDLGQSSVVRYASE